MKILLINKNSSVSKLIGLTAKKYAYEVVEVAQLEEAEKSDFDIVFVDDELAEAIDLDSVKNISSTDEIVYIGSKNAEKPDGYKYMLTKPFLPSDINDLIEKINSVQNETDTEILSEEIIDEVQEFKLEDYEDKDVEKDAKDKNEDEPVEELIDEDLFIDNEDEIIDDLDKLLDEAGEEDVDIEDKEEVENEDSEKINNADNSQKKDEEEIIPGEELDIDIEENDETEGLEDKDSTASILDKDEIDEVKTLLEESSDENEALEMDSILTGEEDSDNNNEDNTLPVEEKIDFDEIKDDFSDEDVENFDFDSELSEADSSDSEIDKEQDLSASDISDTEENKNSIESETSELDNIDEKSIKELFGEESIEDEGGFDFDEELPEAENNETDEEKDMIVEQDDELKPKKKKKKKIKNEDYDTLKEEIASKLLDIDTLRDVLDGMEIRIKFYNKNKK